MQRKTNLARVGSGALLTFSALLLAPHTVYASDHADGESVAADPIADLADLYVWPTDDDTLVAVITFGVHAPGEAPPLDPDVLYTLHIDNTADPYFRGYFLDPLPNGRFLDSEADIEIHIRFAENSQGEWGMQVTNLPGARQNPLVGVLGRTIDGGAGTRAMYGIYDNPFFFDIDGFNQTLANLEDAEPSDLAFSSVIDQVPVDGFAGTNVHAIALEFAADIALGDNRDNFLQFWVTTSRVPPLPGGDESGTGGSTGDAESGSGSGTGASMSMESGTSGG